MFQKLYWGIFIAFIVGAIAVAVSYFMQYVPNCFSLTPQTQQWWRDGLLGLGSGIIGAIVVIFLFDRVVLKNERQEQKLKNQIALNGLRHALKFHFESVLFGMYRAATSKEKKYATLDELFGEDYFSELEYLDFNQSPFSDKSNPYYEIIPQHNDHFSKYLREDVLPFGQFLNSDIIQVIQDIRFSKFMNECSCLPSVASSASCFLSLLLIFNQDSLAKNHLPKDYSTAFMAALRRHIDIFKALVAKHDEFTAGQKLIDDLLSPNTGCVTIGCCRVDDQLRQKLMEQLKQGNSISGNFSP